MMQYLFRSLFLRFEIFEKGGANCRTLDSIVGELYEKTYFYKELEESCDSLLKFVSNISPDDKDERIVDLSNLLNSHLRNKLIIALVIV